jgi:hypothetical protein
MCIALSTSGTRALAATGMSRAYTAATAVIPAT